MKKAISKRKIKSEETKKKILSAARRLFQEHGFENVSIESIVKAAGVSKGAFYVHFESKDAIAAVLVVDYINKVDWDYRTFLDTLDPAAPVSDVLISLAGKIADVIADAIGHNNMRMLYKFHLIKTIDTNPSISYSREIYNIFAEILEKGVRQGELTTDLPVDTLARHCVLALRGVTFEWCIRYPDFDLRQQCQSHLKLLLNGIIKQ